MDLEKQGVLLTADDLYALPDDGLRYELLAGRLISEPPVGGTHGRVAGRLAELLGAFARSRSLGAIYVGDTGFLLAQSPDTVRAPDLAFLGEERRKGIQDESRFLPGAPDLAIEVLSPGDRAGEVRAKVADYLQAGARLVWVVDPKMREVSVYRTLFSPRILRAEDRLEGEDVLPGFSVKVAEIFST